MDKNIKLNDDGTVSPIDPAKPSRYTTEPTIEAILDKLWKDAWGKLGAYDFDGTGEDTLTKAQAQEAIERIISDQVAKARIEAFDVAFDCHDYDRLRAYRAELLKEVK